MNYYTQYAVSNISSTHSCCDKTTILKGLADPDARFVANNCMVTTSMKTLCRGDWSNANQPSVAALINRDREGMNNMYFQRINLIILAIRRVYVIPVSNFLFRRSSPLREQFNKRYFFAGIQNERLRSCCCVDSCGCWSTECLIIFTDWDPGADSRTS